MTLVCVRQPGDTMKLLTVATLIGLWALICTLIVGQSSKEPPVTRRLSSHTQGVTEPV